VQFCFVNKKQKINFKSMNTLRNSVRLVGHLGMDPEVKSVGNDKQLARLSLATNESYKNDKGERITETQWHNLTVWGVQAKFAEDFLKKGDEIAIEGRIANRNYTDKEGTKRYSTEIVVNEFLKLSSKS